MINTMPIFATFFLLFAMANAGLPGTSGFVGEFMVIVGSLHAGFWIALIAAMTLILGAAYTLWMVKRVIFGEVANDNVAALTDIRGVEIMSYTLLAAMVLIIGVYPQILLNVMHSSVDNILHLATSTKL